MAGSLDQKSVIFALTDGIGVQFGRAARKSFFQQLERLERHETFCSRSTEEQQLLVDLLAVASFYQSVIIPIRSSARFVSVLRKAGATHLRVARDKLDARHANRAWAITQEFQTVLTRAEIPEHILTYSTLKQFVDSAREFMKGRE